MPCSLKDAVQQQQPKCTKSTIKQALHSIGGAQRVWCVVEAPDDVKVYEQFFDKAVSILPSDDEDGRRSCRNVESIVSELHAEEGNLHLLGIRDCDYTRYDDSYKAPNHVFVTDCRDIEMMMFNAPSVIEGLQDWNAEFPEKIDSCARVERYLGYLRIYNDLRQLSCIFRDKLTKVSLVWDCSTHSIKSDYRKNLFDEFKKACEAEVTEEDFNCFVEEKQLEEEPYVNVCRGHDMLNLLPNMMIQQEYSKKKDIRERMVKSYSCSDFSNTHLYNAIKVWANTRSLVIFKSCSFAPNTPKPD